MHTTLHGDLLNALLSRYCKENEEQSQIYSVTINGENHSVRRVEDVKFEKYVDLHNLLMRYIIRFMILVTR